MAQEQGSSGGKLSGKTTCLEGGAFQSISCRQLDVTDQAFQLDMLRAAGLCWKAPLPEHFSAA